MLRLIEDRVSRATWTATPGDRGQGSGLIVDNFRSEPELRSRYRAGLVDRIMSIRQGGPYWLLRSTACWLPACLRAMIKHCYTAGYRNFSA